MSTSNNNNNNFHYDTVPIDEDLDLLGQAEAILSGDPSALDALMRGVEEADARDAPPPIRPELVKLPVVIDDFVRNYFTQNGFLKSLEAFELEWYTKHGSTPQEQAMCVPDVYVEMSRLQDKNNLLSQELNRQKDTALRAVVLWEKAKKERDLHKVNHTRVVQEKGRMVRDMRRLQDHTESIEPTVVELKAKYENAQKERMLLRLDRDKLAARVQQLEDQIRSMEQQGSATALAKDGSPLSPSAAGGGSISAKNAALTTRSASLKNKTASTVTSSININNRSLTASSSAAAATAAAAVVAPSWPADTRINPNFNTNATSAGGVLVPPSNYGSWSCRNTIKGHNMSVPCVAIHPKKPAAASCSDDGTWRLFSLPRGELLLKGEGQHQSWIAGIAIHPKGTLAATASGDMTVKIWDFASDSCKYTLKAHADGVWCVDFQETGELLLSGSLDHSCRVWDVETGKCRQALRGHVEAVNRAIWQPFTNNCLTGSADKTVSLWDARMSTCVQTLYGHRSAVTSVACVQTSAAGYEFASCDAVGIVTTWDMRTMQAKKVFNTGPAAANCVAFDATGRILAVASEDTSIKMINLDDDKTISLKGHDDAVLSCSFDPVGNGFLVSSGADGTVRFWN